MTLNDIKTEQDKLFDEKFGEITIGEILYKESGWLTRMIKDYIASRDLAIENAVRAESVEKIETLEFDMKGLGAANAIRVAHYNQALTDVLALLTTSPSR